ncbi:hypothetical protein PBCVFr5L_904R [Paramecium bursaria Chlorella virus Fr5L]|nr:hypothetical protein PBCVFr5L_904R [Paramecium bursaria Chlorella virus Fr5L]
MRVFLFIVIAALLALTIYLWRNKNTQKCDCSAAIDEGYDLGVVDGLNALEDEPAIETYGNMDEETSYDCLYRPRETPDGGATWKCRDGWKDTGLNWGDPDGGIRQCMQCKGAYPNLKGGNSSPATSTAACPAGFIHNGQECVKTSSAAGKSAQKKLLEKRKAEAKAKGVDWKTGRAFDDGSKKYQQKTGSKFVRPSGGVCPNETTMVPSGKWGGWCQRSMNWYQKYRGKDSKSGKLFTCTSGRVAVGNTCICGDGKIWKNGKCMCDSSRGLRWNNSEKRCTTGGGSSGGGKSSSSGGGSSSSGCKPGQIRRASDNKCVCAPGTSWDGSKCSGGSSGGGKSSSSGGGSSSSGCKPGQIRRASDNKCVCNPPTKWNGSRCA